MSMFGQNTLSERLKSSVVVTNNLPRMKQVCETNRDKHHQSDMPLSDRVG